MSIRTIYDKILFTFDDDHGKKGFNNVSEGGIVFASFQHDLESPRWGKVLSIGEEVKHIDVGDRILIEALRWTESHKHDGLEFWMTTEDQVMLVEKPE